MASSASHRTTQTKLQARLNMIRRVALGVVLSGLALPSPLRAADNACLALKGVGKQLGCVLERQHAADKALRDFVDGYEQRVSGDQQILLQQAQTRWDLYRLAACKFKASGVAGTENYPLAYGLCMARLSAARLAELQAGAACAQLDTECEGVTGPSLGH